MKAGREIKASEKEKAYQVGNDWAEDLVTSAKRGETRAWFVAGAAVVVVLGQLIIPLIRGPQEVAYPVVISVDKASGNMEVMEVPNEQIIGSMSKLLDQYWAKSYVIARESYFYPLLQRDYDNTLALSSDDVGMEYSKAFTGKDSLDKKLGDRFQVRVRIISVVLPPDEQGKAVVRFAKSMKQLKTNGAEPELTFVATMSYKYEPSQKGQVSQLMGNPMGFKVTAYRVDAELMQPVVKKEG